MGLPRAVQEAIEAADAMVAGMENGGLETHTPVEPTQVAPQTPTEPTPVTPPAEPPKVVDWEQKYRSLQGMFDAEVPRLHAQNRALKEQFDILQQQVQQRPVEPPKVEKLITDQDRESFGPDLVSLIERGVKEATQPLNHELDRLRQENGQLRSQVGNVQQSQAQSAEHTFYANLERAVPEMREINFDPDFLAWLNEVDPLYGIPKKMALDNAAERHDVQRAAAIFNAFKATKAPAVVTPPPRNDLQRQVTPARSRSVVPPQTEQKMLWTQDSINAFYSDLRRGFIETAEAARLEADLLAAAAEGRVQG